MKVGIIGLGKMGLNLALNAASKGHEITAYDLSQDRLSEADRNGIKTAGSLQELVNCLEGHHRILWLMIPAGEAVDNTIDLLVPMLESGDILIDGGNSFYKDSMKRYEKLKDYGISFLDAGVSGGTEGALCGVCTMIGGDREAFDKVEKLFKDISVEDGYMYTGKSGSGHFTKMIHNGIEYGMMQAIGEGFEIMDKSEFSIDYGKIANLWNNGSVIRGWLMGLTASAFSKDQKLDKIEGVMYSSGEGLWTAQTALELKVPAPIITNSVIMRYRSEQDESFSGKVVAALRNEFGGHKVKTRE